MANWYEPTTEQRALWASWVAERPERVRVVAERFTPWTMYRLKNGHRVQLGSFDEPEDAEAPVTMKVLVTSEFNFVAFERTVFGVGPEDLEECELPLPTEIVGSPLTPPSPRPALQDTAEGLEILEAFLRVGRDALHELSAPIPWWQFYVVGGLDREEGPTVRAENHIVCIEDIRCFKALDEAAGYPSNGSLDTAHDLLMDESSWRPRGDQVIIAWLPDLSPSTGMRCYVTSLPRTNGLRTNGLT